MIFWKYDYETDLRIQIEEAIETIAENAIKKGSDLQYISDITGLSLNDIIKLKKNLDDFAFRDKK